MTEYKELLHEILKDAKSRIENGVLYDDDGDMCTGICQFVWFRIHYRMLPFDERMPVKELLLSFMREYDPTVDFTFAYGKAYDFTDPKRLALLDWLIERTAP